MATMRVGGRLAGLVRRHIQSIASLGIRGLSVLAGFALSFIIGHRFGPEANGVYALITQSAMFLSVVAVGGLDLAIVREFSVAVAQRAQVSRASLLRVVGYALGFAALIIAALMLGGPRLLHWAVGGMLPAGGLILLCIMLVARACTRIASAVLRAERRYMLGQSVEVLIIPLIALSAIATGIVSGVESILWATAAGGIATALLGVGASLAGTSAAPAALDVRMRPLLRIALPLWGVAIALNVADWYGLVVVANVLGVYEAGLYRMAMQIGTGFAIVSMGLFSVFSPQISAAFAAGDRLSVARLARTATRLSAAFTLPPAVLLMLFAEPLLRLIGPEFAAAAPMLRVIVIGQILYTITGPAGLVLAMTGHERVNLAITLTSTLSLIIIAPLVATAFGAIGVAAYIAVILVARNIASLVFVRRLTGINVMAGTLSAHPAAA